MFEKEVKVSPSYDRRSVDGGIHCCDMDFILRGTQGVVVFKIFTGWYSSGSEPPVPSSMGADLGYHSKRQLHEWETPDKCTYLHGDCCFYDGSSLMAEEMFEVLKTSGSEVVWEKLEEYYINVFGNDPPVNLIEAMEEVEGRDGEI
jgi:hypothetical protein